MFIAATFAAESSPLVRGSGCDCVSPAYCGRVAGCRVGFAGTLVSACVLAGQTCALSQSACAELGSEACWDSYRSDRAQGEGNF